MKVLLMRTIEPPTEQLNEVVRSIQKLDRKSISKSEQTASWNDSRTLFRIVINLTGTDTSKSMPIKSKTGKVFSSEEQQKQRWVVPFSEVLNQPNPRSLFNFTNDNDIDDNNSNITVDDITCDELSNQLKR